MSKENSCLKVRLDKLLSNNGFGSRKEVRHFIRSKIVSVNGQICSEADADVFPDTDKIAINGQLIQIRKNIYLMMNKAKNYVCSTRGGVHPTVYDLLSDEHRSKFLGGEIHTIGRLDVDTEGLLIFTSDGAMTHRLESPKYGGKKTYLVYLRDKVCDEDKKLYIEKLACGLHIEREGDEAAADCKPAECVWLNATNFEGADEVCTLTVTEGKFHEVKRLFLALGNEVKYLKRLSMNGLKLDENLKCGEYRELTAFEVALLNNENKSVEEL